MRLGAVRGVCFPESTTDISMLMVMGMLLVSQTPDSEGEELPRLAEL